MVETSSASIEKDILDLEKRLAQKKAALEHEKSDKELIHGIIGEKIQEHAPQYSPSSPLPSTQTPTPQSTEPPSYLDEDLKEKVQHLAQIVFDKNLEEGIREAAKTNDSALIDAFHDYLVDELYSQLIEKKKLEKIE